MRPEWFATWFDTEYYHLLYQNRSNAEADAFVRKLFEAQILRTGMRVLDLACGKGRHAVAMHGLGASEVIGVDLSPHSIEAARKSEQTGLRFFVHDMRKPFPAELGMFDAVTNLFTSFGYFSHAEENGQVLANVARLLRPGGTFVLDFLNSAPTIQNLVPEAEMTCGNVRFHLHKKLQEGIIVKTIEVDDAGKKAGPFQERVQALSPAELVQLCETAGLEVAAVYGDYQLGPLDQATSPRCILVCQAQSV